MRFLYAVGFVAVILVHVSCGDKVLDPLFRHYSRKSSTSSNLFKRTAVTEHLRGRKHFDPEEDGFFDDFGLRKGQYYRENENIDFTDIQSNIPGEPGVDYAAYLEIPKTSFSCIGRDQGYYADEETGCQVFHVCDDEQISSFLCPVGSLFSQHLLTCDWWSKVDCSRSRAEFWDRYHDKTNPTKKILQRKNNAQSKNSLGESNYMQRPGQFHNTIAPAKKFKDSPIIWIMPLQPRTSTTVSKARKFQPSLRNENDQNRPKLTDGPWEHNISSVDSTTPATTVTTVTEQHFSSVDSTTVATVLVDEQTNINDENSTNEEIEPTQESKVESSTIIDDMLEVKESIGLISAAQSETTGSEFDSTSTGTIVLDLKNGNQKSLECAGKEDVISDKKIIDVNLEDKKLRLLNITVLTSDNDYEVTPSPKVTTTEYQLQDSTTSYPRDITVGNNEVQQQRKTKNIHNITGFKINIRPVDSDSYTNDEQQKIPRMTMMSLINFLLTNNDFNSNNDGKQDSNLDRFRVNYRTHYYPELIFKEVEDDDQASISNENSRNEQQRQHVGESVHYADNTQQDDDNDNDDASNIYSQNFGIRIPNGSLKPYSKILENKEISRNAYQINSELFDKPANLLWVMSQAIDLKNNDDYVNQFQQSQEVNYDNQEPLIEPPKLLNNGGETTSVQTEFIPSLGFDFNDEEEKKKFYEKFQIQNVSSTIV